MDRRLSTSSDSGFKEGSNHSRSDSSEYNPAKCRITKPSPPKPAQNPLQFVKIGPCDLYRSAQEQLKKVEVIKKIKNEFKDEAEDWQSNLDSWKNNRRKRQEHIIERVVEIKNMEQESEKSRRRSKTFSEMLEERTSRRRKLSIAPLYSEDDGNNWSDLGISTPSRKDSISGESNVDDSQSARESDAHNSLDNINYKKENGNSTENGLFSPSPEEYTYESAIQGYKTRVKPHTRRSYQDITQSQDRIKDKNEDRRSSVFTFHSMNMSSNELSAPPPQKSDVPKIDISKRKQLFETRKSIDAQSSSKTDHLPDELSQSKSIKERLKHLEKCTEESMKIKKAAKRLSGDIMTVRERLSSLVSQTSEDTRNCDNVAIWASAGQLTSANNVEKPSRYDANRKQKSEAEKSLSQSLKDSLSKLDQNNQSNKTNDDANKDEENCWTGSSSPVYEKGRTFHCSLDSLDIREADNINNQCSLEHVQSLDGLNYCGRSNNYPPSGSSTELLALSQCGDTDREDSGIQTADVSCSVSQADEPDEDSADILAAINNVRVERTLLMTGDIDQQNIDVPAVTMYLNTLELTAKDHRDIPTKSPDQFICDNENSQISLESKPSEISETEPNNVEEELIKCTINTDIKTKLLFDDSPVPTEEIPSIIDPLAPARSMEPPKEKPPPPPVDPPSDEEQNIEKESEFKRLNSTKRIKSEIRNKRSSFLGIEGLNDDYLEQELMVTRPPDANIILQEELQLEKQMYRRSQSYQVNDSSPGADVESRDSGVELESRSDNIAELEKEIGETEHSSLGKISQSCEEDEITKKEREIIENLEKEEQWRHTYSQNHYTNETDRVNVLNINEKTKQSSTVRSNKDSNDSQVAQIVNNQKLNHNSPVYDEDHSADVLRVERELLQLEQEELERQKEDLLFRNSIKQRSNNIISQTGLSLQDISSLNSNNMYSNHPTSNYYQSTPDLQPRPPVVRPLPPIPPAKPVRVSERTDTTTQHYNANQMSRHTLHALSATPRSRLMNTDSWIQPQLKKGLTLSRDNVNYNQHWLIQEAEQRRISEQQRLPRSASSGYINSRSPSKSVIASHEKHIPDAVVQTLHQRLQNRPIPRDRTVLNSREETTVNRDHLVNRGIPFETIRGRQSIPTTSSSYVGLPPPVTPPSVGSVSYDNHEKMLSVSGKKKCSHCGDELGRGAAMIIESLCLFYHMDCFKCCVCHVQLGDGLMGTDVRVRNQKLHCHNCYSSDDGVKFSCV